MCRVDRRAAWRALSSAYEPVWAIGTGKVATPEHAQQAHAIHSRPKLRLLYGDKIADVLPILYGGSVTAENASRSGTPAGRGRRSSSAAASLKVDSFLAIVKAAG